ncbi:MAG: hypothetical protein Kow0099_36120 [Candidatus Abyssubacteria bacterium]
MFAQQDMKKMLLRSDKELREFYPEHADEFSKIRSLAESGDLEAANKAARNLHCSAVVRDSRTGIIEIVIGGLVDNAVGYMYVPDGQSKPEMTPDEYIYVERIADNWFLFKTT